MPSLRIKRGTRSQLNTAASGSGLKAGEPYLITDESRIAVGLTAATYQDFLKVGEVSGGRNIDGGAASTVYLATQLINGGGANG